MSYCVTVNGTIHTSNLGHCQPHEHLYVNRTPASESNPLLRIDNLIASVSEVEAYIGSGGKTIVDAQPIGAGRNVRALVEISRQTGLNIISATGYHLPVFYPTDHFINTASENKLYDIFMEEITNGMFAYGTLDNFDSKTTSKAGIIKAAINSEGITPAVRTKLTAAARAAADSGLAIMLHTDAGCDALTAVDLLSSCAVAPDKIIVCHVDRKIYDYSIHTNLAKEGVYLEYDTIGRFKYHDDASEIKLLQHMLDCGFVDNLLISLDTTAGRMVSYGGEIGLSYLFETFIPLMQEYGISSEVCKRITIDNPAKALSKTKI